ncbi:hypothetical protein J6590_103132 [Homalodisca vitripennis]|nr:hypothetical protein J6590_103132 [Homalodisca vitripennis]
MQTEKSWFITTSVSGRLESLGVTISEGEKEEGGSTSLTEFPTNGNEAAADFLSFPTISVNNEIVLVEKLKSARTEGVYTKRPMRERFSPKGSDESNFIRREIIFHHCGFTPSPFNTLSGFN